MLPAACDVLDVVGQAYDLDFTWTHFDWSCERYARDGAMMPEDGIAALAEHDQVFLGAVGFPGVPDHVSLWGLLIPIRRAFLQYVNLRPVLVLPGMVSPLRGVEPGDVDILVVRENSEGEYSELGGRFGRGTAGEMAVQESVFTRTGVERIARYAATLAQGRDGRLASATKSNGSIHTMPFWDEVVREVVAEHDGVSLTEYHVDALAALFVLDPGRFDGVVASNLFGDCSRPPARPGRWAKQERGAGGGNRRDLAHRSDDEPATTASMTACATRGATSGSKTLGRM